MSRKLSICLVALLAASPALAQSVVDAPIISESAIQVQPLSSTLGSTESLAIVSPELAQQLIQVPVVPNAPMVSGEVSPTLGQTESLAVVSESQAQALIAAPVAAPGTFFLSDPEPSIINTLPRITPAQAATFVADSLSISADAEPVEEEISIYVVGTGEILPSGAWSAQDSAACKASGGIELPLPADRTACFQP